MPVYRAIGQEDDVGTGREFGRRWRLAACALLAAGLASPSLAQTQTGTAQTVVVGRLSLLNTGPLDFGYLSSGATAGTCTIDADTGARTTTGGVTPLGGSFGAASFVGAGTPNRNVLIREPNGTITLTRLGGSETMTISNFRVNGGNGTSRKIAADGTLAFRVAGRLNVGASQRDGVYVGTFPVTVDYN